MTNNQALPGYTLPVFACASAVAALNCLHKQTSDTVEIDLIEPPQTVSIPIEQVAPISASQALAITRSEPGNNLDLTRHTPVWALVEVSREETANSESRIIIQGGEGIGKQINADNQAAIYSYATRLIRENLAKLLLPGEQIKVTIILPKGRSLATRTSNAAFGVVEGLSLLGTTGISQPLSAPGQLELYQEELTRKAREFDSLVFCVGENGLDLARKMGINPQQLVKTANWLGSMLVTAGEKKVKSILLFGYHGKLIKLAGGIFHTHHHLADGRLEVFTAHCAKQGLPTEALQEIFSCPTTEAALQYLRELDSQSNDNFVGKVYHSLAVTIDKRAQDYIYNHCGETVSIGSILFDRQRQIIITSPQAQRLPILNSEN